MSLNINSRQSGNVTIIDLSGRITLGDGTGALRDAVKNTMAAGNKNIVLNLADVSYIDSAGLGELVGCFTTVNNQGGKLKLLNLQKKIKDLMQITKLHTIFEVADDEAKAVGSF
jgi:anti-sigma B factor antagonist